MAKQAEPPQEVATAASVVDEVDVTVSVELGRSLLTLDQALDLDEHSLMQLDRSFGEPVEVRLNGKLFAQGEVVTVNEYFGVRLTRIVAGGGAGE